MNILAITFFIVLFIILILMFGLLFFISGLGWLVGLFSYLIFRNREDCPFCHCRKSMRMIKTESGYKKVCDRCKFSVEVEDKKENE